MATHLIVFVANSIEADLFSRLTDEGAASTVPGMSVADIMDPGGGLRAAGAFTGQPRVEETASPGVDTGLEMGWRMSDDQLDTFEALIDPAWTTNNPAGSVLSYYPSNQNVTEPTNGQQRVKALFDNHPGLFPSVATTIAFTLAEAHADVSRKNKPIETMA